jgi:hypothetical protein
MDPGAAGVVQVEGGRQADAIPSEAPMHDIDPELQLDRRLTALEARAPSRDDPPTLPTDARRRRRFAVSLAMAPALVIALVATAVAGSVVISRLTAEGYPGVENPGQPLYGASMECMTPPKAEAFLAAHGYSDVRWQVETGTMVAPDGGKGTSSTAVQDHPPAHGYVIPGSIGGDGRLTMIVDQRTGATGIGDCFGAPMP